MHIRLSPTLRTEVTLPASKSLSARALILNALSGSSAAPEGLSDCDDTRAVMTALRHNPEEINIGAAGTAMRFLTAFYATREGETHVLSGTRRMHQRPIGILVDALRMLGAEITYEQEEGFPPLRIRGRRLRGGLVRMAADVSSQYISAILMIGPTLSEGLHLVLEGEIASAPYLEMTIRQMTEFGAKVRRNGHEIVVSPSGYLRPPTNTIEPDWSAASYWYELTALSPDPDARVLLRGLRSESMQGDAACSTLFEPLGVYTRFTNEGAILTRTKRTVGNVYRADFSDTPDLAQAVVVTCAMLGQAFHFTGLKSLKIKETDRIAALKTELSKYGLVLTEPNEGELAFSPTADTMKLVRHRAVTVATYDDHRMAMAFAPTALCAADVEIENPEVVSKSYPLFWDALRALEN